MKGQDFLGDHRLPLEQAFLRRASPGLRARLRGPRRRSREECMRACGAADRELLDVLLRLGLTPESVAALYLVPLLAVAWARGRLEVAERGAWLIGAEKCGVAEDAPAYELLGAWLAELPDRDLFEAWSRLVRTLCDHLDDERRDRLRAQLVGRAAVAARAAADAAGAGPGGDAEQERELAKLRQAF